MSRLQGKNVIITGAASGMGKAAAVRFISEGARVLLVDKNSEAIEQTAGEIASPDLFTFNADLARAESAKEYTEFALSQMDFIDVAIFNAGICGANMPLEDYPEELFNEVMAVNLMSAWHGMRAIIPHMKQRRIGSIIMTSSIQGLSALPGTTAYTTSKHALVGMMKGAALELAEHGVRVNTVHPGYVSTPMMDTIHKAVMPDDPEGFEQAISQSVPMKRYARPEEIAGLMLYLASDESSYCTGACFAADGGILAALP